MNDLIRRLSGVMENEWYSLFWNEDIVYVVFRNKILSLKNQGPWDEKEFNELADYAESQGTKRTYIDNIRKTITDW